MLKTSPRPRRAIAGATARVTRKTLRRLTATMRSKSATAIFKTGRQKTCRHC